MMDRLEICSLCELREYFFTGLKGIKYYKCSGCGCPLKAKASEPEEECPHPEGDKWKGL